MKVLLLICSFPIWGYSLNLTITDYHDPVANHILDAEVAGDILIISAMVQGIEFYDISNPAQLNHLTNFNLGGGGWGGGVKANCVRASGNYAYFTTYSGDGLYVVNFSNPSNPQNLGVVSGTDNLNLENLDLNGNILAVCAHENGVRLYDISNPSNPTLSSAISAGNAWAVAVGSSHVYIADDDIISIYDVTDPSNPAYISTIQSTNAVKDLALLENHLYAATGSDGVSLYDISDAANPILLDTFNTNTMANRIAAFDGKIAVADWDDVDVVEYNGSNLVHVGYKNTGNRTMAIAASGDYLYSAEWKSVHVFRFGSIEGADMDLNTWELNYPFVGPGDSFSMTVEVKNNGSEMLTISDNYTTHSEFEIVNPLTELNPGESQLVEIAYNATNGNAAGVYRIYSNDPDEPLILCETNGNIDGANIGEAAPDFNLEIVANGSGNFQLSQQLGSVVVIAFFSPM
ncbi:MAG: hypothetical protein QF472_07105 [Candidatus Marinimicrobia bacterium]|nr:hypothetical protein [Candidatus Neomarinimicrobiota bacterium]MDP6853703.1 hypothetical protein [Candidatus Neomarinimicrobiota bacterium]